MSHMDRSASNDRKDYHRRLDHAFRECETAGLSRYTYDPWPDRILRRMGLRPRPPHYRGRSWLAVTMSLVAIGWTAGAWLFGPEHTSGLRAVVGGLIMALIVGVGQAWETGHQRRKHGLSKWEDL